MKPELREAKARTLSMNTKMHTAGPWKQHGCFIWSPAALANIAALSALRPSHIIEYVPPELGDKDLEEVYANGRLLAAAPELLEALEAIVANPDMADGEEPRRLIANARAAIANATQPR